MRLTLVLLPQELGGSFIGWLRIIALIGMESLEVQEDETLGMGGSARWSLGESMEESLLKFLLDPAVLSGHPDANSQGKPGMKVRGALENPNQEEAEEDHPLPDNAENGAPGLSSNIHVIRSSDSCGTSFWTFEALRSVF
jgi:hypothetical protein